jgi:hypothetical protein
MAMSAFAAVNASAEVDPNGHFVHDSTGPVLALTGVESGTHRTELTVPGLTGITCDNASYTGTVQGNTVIDITIIEQYFACKTTGGTAGETTVDTNDCFYTFTISKSSLRASTVHILCFGAKKYIAVTHQGCEIRVPQQLANGVSYTTVVENGKHAITVDAAVTGLTTHFEAGFCVLLGTSKTSNLTGSVTVRGFEDLAGGAEGNAVNITATGSEG